MVATALENIEQEVRIITGRTSTAQLTSAQIRDAINNFYLYDLPEYLRTFRLRQPYTFTTEANVDTYNFPYDSYTSVEPPAFVGGYRQGWYQDTSIFYGVWPRIQQISQVATGDGSFTYTGTISAVPFLRCSVNAQGGITLSNVLFTANEAGNTQVIKDGPPFVGSFGTLYDYNDTALAVPRGSVNYVTGAFSVSFPVVVSSGTAINVQIVPYGPSRPIDICFYNNQFILRPVPDQAYQVDIVAYALPTELLTSSSDPALKEWWLMLAYGASLRIFKRYPDPEGMALAEKYLTDEYDKMESRTCKQLSTQRANTIFSEPRNVYAAGYYLPIIQ